MKFLYLFYLFLIMTFFNCQDGPNQSTGGLPQTRDAVLSWQGPYEVDGCGFFVMFDNKRFKPENENEINSEFMKYEDFNVSITFTFLDHKIQYSCGDLPSVKEIDGIRIIQLTRK